MKFSLAIALVIAAATASGANAGVQLNFTGPAGGSGTINGLATDFFTTTDNQSTGSGVIQSFVRVSAANQSIVQGYNTDARPLQFDENNSGTFTRSLQLSAVPIVTIGGVAYREFLLDINQNNNDPLLSLNELEIYLENSGGLLGTAAGFGSGTGFASGLVYQMNTSDSRIDLNYNLNSGSGSGDMFAYIANSLFTGPNQSVYLYSKFGDPNANNDGYEEWAVRTTSTLSVVPEPSTLGMGGLALGLLGLGYAGRRRRMASA